MQGRVAKGMLGSRSLAPPEVLKAAAIRHCFDGSHSIALSLLVLRERNEANALSA
jgi:hypothetical protein